MKVAIPFASWHPDLAITFWAFLATARDAVRCQNKPSLGGSRNAETGREAFLIASTEVSSSPSDRLAVSVREAGRLLSVSPRTIQNYIHAKMLPARKIGRRTVIPVRALEAFLRRDQPSPFAESNGIRTETNEVCDAR
jgi:excisionase family DNA binding protein